MVSVDTNILVRLITRDDPIFSPRARDLVVLEQIFIPKTVVLETEWVLRSSYRFARSQIESALRALIGLPHITVENADTVVQALDWFAAGLDFADALHLASTPSGDRFATFDRELAQRVTALADAPEVIEP